MIRSQRYVFNWPTIKHSLPLVCSYLHTHNVTLKNFNSSQRSKLALKFLAKSEMVLKKRKESIKTNPQIAISSIFNQKNSAKNPLRMNRLSVIFMEKITEVLLISEYYTELSEKGFEITQTRVQPGMSSIHIYWTCSNIQKDEDISKTLSDLSYYLRSELNSQRILGKIPPLLFVRDDVQKNSVEVLKRLKIADFGPDFEPQDFFHSSSQPPFESLKKEIDEEIWKSLDKISEPVESSNSSKEEFPYDILTIRKDVFGVNRERIIKNVMRISEESKGLHRLAKESPSVSSSPPYEVSNPSSLSPSTYSRTQEIKKWVLRFKKERLTLLKQNKRQENKDLQLQPSGTTEELLDDLWLERENQEDEENFEYEDFYYSDDKN